jgi:uncharacterized protein
LTVTVRKLRRPLFVLCAALVLAATLAAAALGAAAAGASSAAQAKGIPPAPTRWCTDEAGFLSPRTVDDLNRRLESYERQTGHQLLVWIGRTIGPGQDLEEWAARTFEAWKVGRKGIDDGLVVFILADDRKIKIEVGYGLEDKVPDIYAYRVIANILAPGIRAGRQDEAVESAVTALIGYIGGDENAAGSGKPPAEPRLHSVVKGVFTGIVILVIIILFITNPSLAFWLLLSILGGGRGGRGGGGWGGGGGGGFSGGGGRSGGGGASGGW